MTMKTRTLAVGAALALLAAACSSGTAGESESAAAEPGTIAIETVDYGYRGLPDEVATGTAFTIKNTSETEIHELVAIRLPDDETRSVEDLAKLPPEEFGKFFEGVKAVILAPPGEDGVAVVGDGTLTEPGRYAVVCVIPTGADPAEYMEAAAKSEGGPPDVAGGPPHIVNGMFAEVTVTP